VFLPTDVGVRHTAERLGIDDVAGRSEHWRPWRSYALIHLWSSLGDAGSETSKKKES
jgi:AraC family transcriptional regulator of adaptative response / DNA-3-methyladenine glycosylase II